MKRVLTSSLSTVVLLAAPLFTAMAAGPYDGTWQVDAPPAGQTQPTERSSGCEGLRLRFTVKDNQIHGSMARSPYGGGRVTQGEGRGATPVTGTVQPDGTLNAQWQNLKATGKLAGDKAELRWRGTCGPRVASGGRVTSAEGAGSTSGTQSR